MSDVQTEIQLIEGLQQSLGDVIVSLDNLCTHLRDASFSLKTKILEIDEVAKVLNKTPDEVSLLNLKKNWMGGRPFYDLAEVLLFMKSTIEPAIGFSKPSRKEG